MTPIDKLLNPEVRRFLTRPIVIDWLQWAEHPDRLTDLDMPTVTLGLLSEYKDHVAKLEAALKVAVEKLNKLSGKANWENECCGCDMRNIREMNSDSGAETKSFAEYATCALEEIERIAGAE